MNNTNTLFSKKLKRKSFLMLAAASAVTFYSVIKMPFRLFSASKEESESENNNSLKVTINQNAISRNTRGINGK